MYQLTAVGRYCAVGFGGRLPTSAVFPEVPCFPLGSDDLRCGLLRGGAGKPTRGPGRARCRPDLQLLAFLEGGGRTVGRTADDDDAPA